MALLEAQGAVLGKDELLRRIWPGRIVEEHRLQSEIWALRKAFGADRDLIQTVSGQGYQFAGEIRELGAGVSAQQVPAPLGVFRPAPPCNQSRRERIRTDRPRGRARRGDGPRSGTCRRGAGHEA